MYQQQGLKRGAVACQNSLITTHAEKRWVCERPIGNGLFKDKIFNVCKSVEEFWTKLQPIWMLANISSLNITLQIL